MESSIAGVVLIGGQSSRMGQDKALLQLNGRPLHQHMRGLLQAAGVSKTYFSGSIPGVDGFADRQTHAGPARAVADIMRHLEGQHTHVLVVPVDMPLLDVDILQQLLHSPIPCHYDQQPFPFFMPVQAVPEDVRSVRQLLQAAGAKSIPVPKMCENRFCNVNTPEDWKNIQKGCALA